MPSSFPTISESTHHKCQSVTTRSMKCSGSMVGPRSMQISASDSPVTLTTADSGKTVLLDSSGGNIEVTLPPSTDGVSFRFVVVVQATDGNTITFNAANLENMSGKIISDSLGLGNCSITPVVEADSIIHTAPSTPDLSFDTLDVWCVGNNKFPGILFRAISNEETFTYV